MSLRPPTASALKGRATRRSFVFCTSGLVGTISLIIRQVFGSRIGCLCWPNGMNGYWKPIRIRVGFLVVSSFQKSTQVSQPMMGEVGVIDALVTLLIEFPVILPVVQGFSFRRNDRFELRVRRCVVRPGGRKRLPVAHRRQPYEPRP